MVLGYGDPGNAVPAAVGRGQVAQGGQVEAALVTERRCRLFLERHRDDRPINADSQQFVDGAHRVGRIEVLEEVDRRGGGECA